MSLRDVEDLLAERGITVSYEVIRLWCVKFGLDYVRKLRRWPTRQRERQMGKFKSAAQRFLSVHGVVRNLFSLGWQRLRNYQSLRGRAFAAWTEATSA